jgi:hypothetical protein
VIPNPTGLAPTLINMLFRELWPIQKGTLLGKFHWRSNVSPLCNVLPSGIRNIADREKVASSLACYFATSLQGGSLDKITGSGQQPFYLKSPSELQKAST